MSVLPDPASDFGARVRSRLAEETVIWLVTVPPSGVPQPNPVWFVFEAETESLLIYNLRAAKRLEHIDAHPQVAAHFDGNGRGGDIVVLAGELTRSADDPPANQNAAYLAKYGADIERIGMDADAFAARYSVPLRLRIARVRGH